MSGPGRTGRAVAAAAVGLLLTVGVAACGSDQNPGLDQPSGSGGPTTTGHFLGRCPPGGPDATTPAAGCLDAQGRVQH
jgi:hypothetical protein